jgi:uncharacterized protein
MYQVLSITGGGYFGLYSAYLLQQLEQNMKRPINQVFDCIAGTSIGSSLGMALSLGLPAESCVDSFTQHGQKIFPRNSAFPNTTFIRDYIRPYFSSKYNNQPLRNVLKDLLGEDTLFDQARTTVMIPVYNVTECKPYLFQTLGKGKSAINNNLKMVDVAMAATAAPSLFPLYKIDKAMYIDAGIYACSPDLLTLDTIHHNLGIPYEKIRMLSIGSATAHPFFPEFRNTHVSGFKWMKRQRLLMTQLAAQQQVTTRLLKHQMGPNNYIRLDNSPSKVTQPNLSIDKADSEATNILLDMAKETINKTKDNQQLMNILNHSKSDAG